MNKTGPSQQKINHKEYKHQIKMLQEKVEKKINFALNGNQTYTCCNHHLSTCGTAINFSKKKSVKDNEAKFYCIQHDMFLCKNCFEEHLGHRGAESIKNHLT